MSDLVKTLVCNLLFLLIHLSSWAGESIIIRKLETLQPVISVTLSDKEIETLNQEGFENAKDILAIFLVSNGITAQIPVAGKYFIRKNKLVYTTLYTLGYNMEFEARFEKAGNILTRKRFHTPPNPASTIQSGVETIYPLTDTIPYNALYFHVRFNQPMLESINTFKYVRVLDNSGKEITNAWRHKSFWLDSGRLLVLMIHPGRVKNGIHYESPLFDSGKYYTVKVESGISDRNGNQSSEAFSKKYFIAGEDRAIPTVRVDSSHLPVANSADPVSFIFSEGMDNASVLDGVSVFNDKGDVIPCYIREKESDRIFTVTPLKKWTKGNYHISLNGAIYDFAGNRLNRLFEITDVSQIDADKKTTILRFNVK